MPNKRRVINFYRNSCLPCARGPNNCCTVKSFTAWKVSKYGVFSGPYFPAFGLNMERYSVSLRIQSECGKIRTRKNFVFGHFSRSDFCNYFRKIFDFVQVCLCLGVLSNKTNCDLLLIIYHYEWNSYYTEDSELCQSAFTCSKLTTETL